MRGLFVIHTMKSRRFPILLVAILSGCASPGIKSYEPTTCTDLNNAIGGKAKRISDAAIRRGEVDNLSIPFWIPGGAKAVSAIANRQTAQIGKLQAEQTMILTEREERCE